MEIDQTSGSSIDEYVYPMSKSLEITMGRSMEATADLHDRCEKCLKENAVPEDDIFAILLGIELMLNAVNINLAAFWRYGNVMIMTGQVFAIIVFAVAAAEVAVGLALVISVYRRRNTVVADEIDMMKW